MSATYVKHDAKLERLYNWKKKDDSIKKNSSWEEKNASQNEGKDSWREENSIKKKWTVGTIDM